MSTPARVVLLIGDLHRAGAETQVAMLAQTLDRTRFEPTIVLLKSRNDFAAELDAAGVTVVPLYRRGATDVGIYHRLRAVLRRLKPDVLHSSLSLPNLLAVPAGRAEGVRAIVLTQQSSYVSTLGPIARRLARFVHRRADRVTVVSRAALREELAAGLPPQLLVHVPNAARPHVPPSEQVVGPGRPLVVSVGQLQPVKGHASLVSAWAHVNAAQPDAHLLLVGGGPEAAALEARASELGLRGRVHLHGFDNAATRWLSACDVFVQPSLSEGMPLAVLEAMAAGCAIVATRVGGIPELIEDGRTGLLVPPADPAALGEAIVTLLHDRDLARRLGAAARAKVQDDLSMEAVTRQYEQIYTALLR